MLWIVLGLLANGLAMLALAVAVGALAWTVLHCFGQYLELNARLVAIAPGLRRSLNHGHGDQQNHYRDARTHVHNPFVENATWYSSA